jgi:hypothetical protein
VPVPLVQESAAPITQPWCWQTSPCQQSLYFPMLGAGGMITGPLCISMSALYSLQVFFNFYCRLVVWRLYLKFCLNTQGLNLRFQKQLLCLPRLQHPGWKITILCTVYQNSSHPWYTPSHVSNEVWHDIQETKLSVCILTFYPGSI